MVLKFNNSSNTENFPFFKKRLLESLGLILLAISFAIAASIITFDINDPSFTYLSDSTTNNILGKYGAYISDLLIKLFGASSILIFLIGFVWGLKLFIHKKISFFWIRLIFVPITLLSTSTTLNIENIFSLNLESGGIVGKYTFLYITNFLQNINFCFNWKIRITTNLEYFIFILIFFNNTLIYFSVLFVFFFIMFLPSLGSEIPTIFSGVKACIYIKTVTPSEKISHFSRSISISFSFLRINSGLLQN